VVTSRDHFRQDDAAVGFPPARPASEALLSSSPARIVIADAHAISRDGLGRLLSTDNTLTVVADTGDYCRVVELAAEHHADVLLIDVHGTTAVALEIVRALAASGSPVRTVVLADTIHTEGLANVLEAGARGIVLKDAATETLFASIRTVLSGQLWIDGPTMSGADAAAGLRRIAANRQREKAFGLTTSELEVVRMVVAGCTNKEIGERLSIAENTVKSHLTHIFNKLGASNRVELAVFAAHHRLLDTV
jgi:two-component system, NarL family, nitrate/nitrite response regulator NarL